MSVAINHVRLLAPEDFFASPPIAGLMNAAGARARARRLWPAGISENRGTFSATSRRDADFSRACLETRINGTDDQRVNGDNGNVERAAPFITGRVTR